HPISAYLLSPYTTWYGYLGYPPPDAAGPYRTWTRAYESYGVVPTLSNPTLRSLEHPGPDLRVRLEEMRIHDRADLRPDFDADGGPDDKCVWRGPGAARLVYSRDPEGGSRATFNGRTLYRYVRGRTTVRGPESNGPWPAFDEQGVYGLDPARTYLLEPRPRDQRQPHLLRLPDDVVVQGFRWSADALLFDLSRQIPRQDLLRGFASARTGIAVDGREQPVGERAQLEEAVSTCGGVTRPGLFAHPPWNDQQGVIGSVFAEWTVTPHGTAPVLVLYVGLRDGAEKADGVTFSIAADGRTLWRQDWKRCAWLPVRLDLAPYAGRPVKLRLAVEKGPEGRGSWCWAAWGEPRIEADQGPRALTVDLLAPGRAVAVTGAGGHAEVAVGAPEHGLQRHRVTTSVPGATCVLFRRPEPAALPLNLRTAPFTWTPVAGGMPLPPDDRPGYLSAAAGEGRSGGVARPSLVTHPPSDGFTAIDYVVTLPRETPADLRFSCALQEGAKSNSGVAFRVTVNGREVSRHDVSGPDGWHDGQVDLRAFAGQTVLLSLIVDALGDAVCDWARWGEPRIVARQAPAA
ncbi:MAG: hypothetical protein HYU66_19785, partial [Armatimonadetes bacterium]|nr:hypothetical protein [Armatimonadota bacterium]